MVFCYSSLNRLKQHYRHRSITYMGSGVNISKTSQMTTVLQNNHLVMFTVIKMSNVKERLEKYQIEN